jgi:hypothetical protein
MGDDDSSAAGARPSDLREALTEFLAADDAMAEFVINVDPVRVGEDTWHAEHVAISARRELARRHARALLAHPAPDAGGWRFDMENAPRDGTAILGCQRDIGRMAVVWRWENDRHWKCADYLGMQPTAWMPLPPPPHGGGEK